MVVVVVVVVAVVAVEVVHGFPSRPGVQVAHGVAGSASWSAVPSGQAVQLASVVRVGARDTSAPTAHWVTGLHAPVLPGVSVYVLFWLQRAHGVAGSESWSVVPAAQAVQATSRASVGARDTSVPTAHWATGLHAPTLPGWLACVPWVQLAHGVAGFESWSVVPAAHSRPVQALAPFSSANVPLGHLSHARGQLPVGADPASHSTLVGRVWYTAFLKWPPPHLLQ